MSFGENLVSLRESRGISRRQLSEMLDIPYTTLRNYETDQREPGHKLLISIAHIFSVSVDELIGNTEFYSEEKQIKKTPAPENPETGESKEELELFRRAFYDLGLLREGQNLTPAQAEIILSVIHIIEVTLSQTNSNEEGNKVKGAG